MSTESGLVEWGPLSGAGLCLFPCKREELYNVLLPQLGGDFLLYLDHLLALDVCVLSCGRVSWVLPSVWNGKDFLLPVA